MILHLLELSHCPCCSTFVLIEPTCHHTEEMHHCVSPCAELVILYYKVFQGWCNGNSAAATLEGEVIDVPVGPPLSGISLVPPDLPFHTQAIINTSRIFWIGEESFLFYKQPKAH
jgi:hypothetical protein